MSILDNEKIRALREQKGWDQTQLANAAGIHRSVISRVERGLQTDLRLSVALDIANALDISIEGLLDHKVRSVQTSTIPELQAITMELSKLPHEIQKQAAGILRGYLSTLGTKHI